jgi:hypothetical protein
MSEARIAIINAQPNLTPEQMQQLEDVIRPVMLLFQASMLSITRAVIAAVESFQKSEHWAELARQSGRTEHNYAVMFEEFKRRYDLPAHNYERPRLPSEQGYRRTPYDCWRASLGQGRGKRNYEKGRYKRNSPNLMLGSIYRGHSRTIRLGANPRQMRGGSVHDATQTRNAQP